MYRFVEYHIPKSKAQEHEKNDPIKLVWVNLASKFEDPHPYTQILRLRLAF